MGRGLPWAWGWWASSSGVRVGKEGCRRGRGAPQRAPLGCEKTMPGKPRGPGFRDSHVRLCFPRVCARRRHCHNRRQRVNSTDRVLCETFRKLPPRAGGLREEPGPWAGLRGWGVHRGVWGPHGEESSRPGTCWFSALSLSPDPSKANPGPGPLLTPPPPHTESQSQVLGGCSGVCHAGPRPWSQAEL